MKRHQGNSGMPQATNVESGSGTPRPGLHTRGLGKHFGGVYAVKGVEVAVGDHEIVGLIGPNGAGKTSLMNVISGVVSVDEGDLWIDGQSLVGKSAMHCAAMGVARTFQNIRLFTNLTVRQNVQVALTTAHRHRRAHVSELGIDDFLKLMDVGDVADRKAGTLAYGTQRRVEIARALALHPRVLLLDEPAAGMNETESQDLMTTIRGLSERFGFGILVIDHDLRFIMTLCERIFVMDMGEIIAHGTPGEIRSDPKVQEVYLGGRHSRDPTSRGKPSAETTKS